MNLSKLLKAVGLPEVDLPIEIDSVTRDSRDVGPHTAFVAVVGAHVDGHDFIGTCGAPVVFCERAVPYSGLMIVVENTKALLAQISAVLCGQPAHTVRVVGVTGTNGKTTVTTLVEQALQALEIPTGRVGTTGNQIGGVVTKTAFTTPEAPALQALLAQMREEGIHTALLEASSIGLVQRRVDAIPFYLGVFTNLTQDHLDFHGNMDAYADAKAMLFARLRAPGGAPRALLCADDPARRKMNAPEDQWTYGFSEGADIRIHTLEMGSTGMRLHLNTPAGDVCLQSEQVGRHNALNLAAALGIGLCLGVELHAMACALGEAVGAPGRLEVVPNKKGVLVVVDFAHSDDALARVIPTVRELVEGLTWVVFGAGGDRDRRKRAMMGAVAETFADRVVLTSDNPRSEDPAAIIAEIESGMTEAPVFKSVDREVAIRFALTAAQRGDVVLIAGKGHETTQEIDGTKHPFDDRRVARAILEEDL